MTSATLSSCFVAGQAPAPAPESQADISAGLLRFADSIPNFHNDLNVTDAGWTAAAAGDVCSWQYVICSNATFMLNVTNAPLAGKAQSKAFQRKWKS